MTSQSEVPCRAMIHIKNLSFAYNPLQPVFLNWSWEVNQGDIWCVLGPSGCGKSTLLLLVAGLILPQKGSLLIGDESISRPRPGTGLVLQEYGLLPWATIQHNVALGMKIRKFYGPDGRHVPRNTNFNKDQARTVVNYWLDRLSIRDVADQYPGQISGGQRQRAAIARTLVLNPDILLMDEPFSALDAPTRENLEALTLKLGKEEGLTVILVTHNIEEAAFVGQRILVLGSPPNCNPHIVHNPHQPGAAYRGTTAYKDIMDSLRSKVEQ